MAKLYVSARDEAARYCFTRGRQEHLTGATLTPEHMRRWLNDQVTENSYSGISQWWMNLSAQGERRFFIHLTRFFAEQGWSGGARYGQ